MAHLDPSFDSYKTYLNLADEHYMIDFTSLNNSGVRAMGLIAVYEEDDGDLSMNVTISAQGFSMGNTVVQHIHGLFNDDGSAADSSPPTLANDTDGDGLVEVLEGVPSYGDIIMSLTNDAGAFKDADGMGGYLFMQAYDLADDSLFGSFVTGNDYDAEDLMPLALREVVLHGVDVPAGLGDGTDNEVDGTQDGFVQLLPAAAGEIVEINKKTAKMLLDLQSDWIGMDIDARGGDDAVTGDMADDRIKGGRGSDTLRGEGGDDTLGGNQGNDLIVGGDGDDKMFGGKGADIFGGLAGDDTIKGGGGKDEYHFDAGTGTDVIVDFKQGKDVISLLDNGAIDFANSTETEGRGDSDLDIDDFDFVPDYSSLRPAMDAHVIYSTGGTDDLMNGTGGAAIEAYIAATDGRHTFLYYDEDWSDTEGRETIAKLRNFDDAMTVADFDVY